MASITVTPENLIEKAGQVNRQADKYYNEYTNLLKDVQTLTADDWTGDDAEAFKEKVEGFRLDFEKMKELMNEYARFLKEAAESYQNTQRNAINTINSLR